MTEQELARGLVERVVDENARLYEELFATTALAQARDPYWRAAAALFASLDDTRRQTFLAVLRQVTVDAVSSTLAVLDGVTSLPSQAAELELRHGGEVLSGALQDHFLAEVEAG